jgi:putative flippase GtrA
MSGVVAQSIRFGVVGLVNTAIGLSTIFAVMYFFRAGPAIANGIGYAVGLTASFRLNRRWTFGDKRASSRLLPRFFLVVGASFLLNLTVVLAATSLFSVNPYVAQVFGVCIYTLCMFLGCRSFVFLPQHAVQ